MKRSASVQAMTDLQVLVISQEFLQRAMRSQPDLALKLLYNLSHVLAQKLQTTTRQWQDSIQETRRLAGMLAMPSRTAAPVSSRRAADEERTVIMRKKVP